MADGHLTTLTIGETAEYLATGQATAVEVTTAYLERIKRLNPSLNAYLTVFTESALKEAAAADTRRQRGERLSMLDGIPLAVKDNIATQGQPTTAGSLMLKDYRPLTDATVMRRLRAGGAVILGKTNLDEFAMGSSTENSAYGASRNPWDTRRVPGGSSGGSAVAVAADLCAGALGSDTGGSIRQPAGLCGVVGFKPTYGRVSRSGLLAMASSLDQIGPMTKSVDDAAIIMTTIAGQDEHDATSLPTDDLATELSAVGMGTTKGGAKPLAGLKIGLPKEAFGDGLDQSIAKQIRLSVDRLKELGALVQEISLPSLPLALAVYYIISPVEVASNMARYDGIRFGQSLERESGNHDLNAVYSQSRSRYLGKEVKRRIMLGTYLSSAGYYDAYYHQAEKVRALIATDFATAFAEVDLLVTPVSPTVAFKLGERAADPLAMYLADIYTVPVNPAGLPAISVNCGFVDDLPVGLQIIGPRLADAKVLSAAAAFEAVSPAGNRRPKL